MHSFSKLVLLRSLLAPLTLVAAYPGFLRFFHRANIPPSSQDPFYLPPPGYEKVKPGDILASRPAPGPFSHFQAFELDVKSATQLLYRTTDVQGKPIVGVTTILVP